MRRLLGGVLAAAALVAGVAACDQGSPVFTDNFDQITSQWALYNGPGNGSEGPRTPANVTLGRDADGTTYARLWTRPVNGRYASAGMQLHLTQTYGTYTVRSRSYSYGQGNKYAVMIWPATKGCWPCAENDFNESWDASRQSYMITNHFINKSGQHAMQHHGVVLDLTQWHTFTLDHRAGRDIYKVDSQVIWTNTEHVTSFPMNLAIQTALTGAPNPVPAVLDVDYVQVSR